LILAPFFLQGLELLCALLLLFLGLPGSALASEKSGNDGGSSDSATVSILVCLLLLLLLLLFLAWRRLSQESEGRYHPRTLLRGLLLRWQEFRGEVPTQELSQEYEHERQRDEELGEPQQDDDTEEEEKEEQSLQLQQKAEEEEEKEERFSENADSEPPEKAVLLEPSEKDGASRATESSAEALLSDLHSFSGTAAWEDSGKHLHVTAL
ncbi:protein tyrosine phosphatase receptor type C-associated protein, partial [Tiliqua scincoides]|uniref:protein tyrosine phosphatase receptor type C-associated protein n=1 Tax=Tiliqua scincoides TaxID=71010 RepID=UPI00346296A4